MSDPAIETAGLRREYGTVVALRGLDLEVESGTVFGLLGPNGAGKTTTIRLLLGLIPRSAGEARVFGADPGSRGHEVRQQTGVLLSHNGLYEHLTAAENLELHGRIWRLSASEREERADELLERFGLSDRRYEPVSYWSRGMQQKLAIARALLHRPRLVFLDEPTATLDALAAADLRETLLELVADEKTTLFLTTHNLDEAERMCGRVAILRRGELLKVARPGELGRSTGVCPVEIEGRGFAESQLGEIRELLGPIRIRALEADQLRVDLSDPSEVSTLVKLLVDRGAEIESVHRPHRRLEEAFVELMREQERLESAAEPCEAVAETGDEER